MPIQVVEAGAQCLLGGAVIGAYRTETRQAGLEIIGVDMFQGEAYRRKLYTVAAQAAVAKLFERLQGNAGETVEVAEHFLLARARQQLGEQGYQVKVIAGHPDLPVQVLVSAEFVGELAAMGVPDLNYELLHDRPAQVFQICLAWLKGGDLEAPKPAQGREKLAKTGWPSYATWAYQPYGTARRQRLEAKKTV